METVTTIRLGQKITITDLSHPWHGHTGKVVDKVRTFRGIEWRVRLDKGYVDCACKGDEMEENNATR